MSRLTVDVIRQHLIKYREARDVSSYALDEAFENAVIEKLLKLLQESEDEFRLYLKRLAYLMGVAEVTDEAGVVVPELANKFLSHVFSRMNDNLILKDITNVNHAINLAVANELHWYDAISRSSKIVVPADNVDNDPAAKVADILPDVVDDVTTIGGRILKLFAKIFDEVTDALSAAKDIIGYVNFVAQILSFLYYPFIYIWKGLIKGDTSEINLKNNMLWAVAAVVLILSALSTFLPATVISWPFTIAIFVVSSAMSIYRIYASAKERSENEDRLEFLEFRIKNIKLLIEQIENKIIAEVKQPDSNPESITRLMSERDDSYRRLAVMVKEQRDEKAKQTLLQNPLAIQGNKIRLVLSAVAIAGTLMMMLGGPALWWVGLGLLIAASAITIGIFIAQQYKTSKLTKEANAFKQQNHEHELESTARLFKRLEVEPAKPEPKAAVTASSDEEGVYFLKEGEDFTRPLLITPENRPHVF